MPGTTILRVYSYEPGTKAIKQKRTLELPDASDLSKIDLASIRSTLNKNKTLDSTDVKAPFCDTVGAEVDDTMTFDVYRDQLQDEKKKPDKETGRTEENESHTTDPPPEEPTPLAGILKIYYKKRKVMNKMDDATTEFLKKQLDLKLQRAPELKNLRAEILASSFEASKWQASSGGTRSFAANLTERDWSVITRTNCLLSGYRLIFKEIEVEVDHPKGNAFNLKARRFESYEVGAPPSQSSPAKGAQTIVDDEYLAFHIPRFRIDDASNVNFVETQNTVESSMAESSFSNSSVEASAGGGAFGVSAAVKCGYSRSDQSKSITANAQNHKKIHMSYNFPRVTVFLNEDSLELTDDIKEDIPKVKDKESLKAFTDKYGDIFSRKVKLGGKLTSTSEVDSESSGSETVRENSMKAAAAASFSGFYGSASAEASYEEGGQHKDGSNKQGFSSQLTWAAVGGDTTLCNDPSQWCGTVGDFYNWRIVEFDDYISLPKLISKFEGFDDIEEQFEIAAGYRDNAGPMRRVRTRVKLKEIKSDCYLTANNEVIPLKLALKDMPESEDHTSIEHRILQTVTDTGVSISRQYGDRFDKIWAFETWIRDGGDAHLPHGSHNYVAIEELPRKDMWGDPAKKRFSEVPYLGITERVPKADGRGFLNLVDEGEKKLFKLQTPPGIDPKKGPVRTGDIVMISVHSPGRNKGESSCELGTLMRSKHPYFKDDIFDPMPGAVAFEKRLGGDWSGDEDDDDNYDDYLDDYDERLHHYKVEVLGSSFVD